VYDARREERGPVWFLLGEIAEDAAEAATLAEVEARLAAVEPLRPLRAVKDAPRLSADEVRRAVDGSIVTGLKTVPGQAYGSAYGAAVLDVSIGKFWAALNDETNNPYTEVDYSELQAGSICSSGRKVFQYLDMPVMISDRWWIGILTANSSLARESGGSVRELSWRSSIVLAEVVTPGAQRMAAAGEPIGSTRGAWFAVAIDAYTTWVEYFGVSDPGGAIPSSIASTAATKGVRGNFESIRQFAKEGKPVCPVQ
jgi:hypothetical protein